MQKPDEEKKEEKANDEIPNEINNKDDNDHHDKSDEESEEESEQDDSSKEEKSRTVFDLKQQLALFKIRKFDIFKDIEKMYDITDAEDDKPREAMIFRITDKIMEKSQKLQSMDEEIRIFGKSSSKEYLRYINKDKISQIMESVEKALETCEATIDEISKPENNYTTKDSKVKLPTVKIPKLYGTYKEWQAFYDIHTRLIHNRKDKSNAVKMQYLMDNLKVKQKD